VLAEAAVQISAMTVGPIHHRGHGQSFVCLFQHVMLYIEGIKGE